MEHVEHLDTAKLITFSGDITFFSCSDRFYPNLSLKKVSGKKEWFYAKLRTRKGSGHQLSLITRWQSSAIIVQPLHKNNTRVPWCFNPQSTAYHRLDLWRLNAVSGKLRLWWSFLNKSIKLQEFVWESNGRIKELEIYADKDASPHLRDLFVVLVWHIWLFQSDL